MAFRIQDPVSGLFWKVAGVRIMLAETGDEFTETSEGLVNVFTSGSNVYFMEKPVSWRFTNDGSITSDGSIFISPSVPRMCPAPSREAATWVKVGDQVPTPAAPEPEVEAPEPEVEAPEPEVAAPEPEVEAAEESDEDVPVNRAAALIEEALNAQAAAAEADKDNE